MKKPDRIHNREYLKIFRRDLRNAGTPAEATLWKQLRNSQLDGKKFRRQHSIGPYIVDFFCPEARLAIEARRGAELLARSETHVNAH